METVRLFPRQPPPTVPREPGRETTVRSRRPRKEPARRRGENVGGDLRIVMTEKNDHEVTLDLTTCNTFDLAAILKVRSQQNRSQRNRHRRSRCV